MMSDIACASLQHEPNLSSVIPVHYPFLSFIKFCSLIKLSDNDCRLFFFFLMSNNTSIKRDFDLDVFIIFNQIELTICPILGTEPSSASLAKYRVH